MTGRLEGKVALITGGSRGQGEAEVRAFVTEGAAVVIGDVLEEQGAALAKELGDRAEFVLLDVTDETAWQRAVDAAVDRFGMLTTLVNNAGISPRPRSIVDTTVEAYRAVIEVNQIGAFTGIRTAAPRIIDAGGGSIINISSVNGFVGAPGISGYVSSKFALRGLTKTAAIELGPSGVRVNSVHPGPIDTAMIHPETWGGYDMRPQLARTLPAGRVGQPAEVADLVVWLASDASAFCTGAEFVVDGGFLAGPPSLT